MEILMSNTQLLGIPETFLSTKYSLNPNIFQLFSKFSLTPIVRISLNRDNVKKNRSFSVKAANLIDGVERNFEFQPAFDEYLKAMESVKTVREKIPVKKDEKFKENSAGKDVWRGVREEEEGKSLQLGIAERRNESSKGRSDMGLGESVPRKSGVRGSREISKKSSGDGVMRGSSKSVAEKGSTRKSIEGSSRSKIESRENGEKFDNEKGMGEKEDGGSRYKSSRMWVNGNAENGQKLHRTSLDRVTRNGRDQVLDGEGVYQKRKRTELPKKQLISNTARETNAGRNLKRTTQFTSSSKRVPERQESRRSNTGSILSDSALDQTLIDWEEFTRSGSGLELGENGVWRKTDVNPRDEVEKQIDVNIRTESDVSVRTESERSNRYQSDIRPNRNESTTRKVGFRGTKTQTDLDKDHTHIDATRNRAALKSGNFTRVNKYSKEDIAENDVEMERAAFKSFEVFTDLRGQPRVLRMEMEERIQNLAKWLNGTDINMPEWLFSKMIHSARITFSDHSILRVIQILGELGNWRRALQVIEWFQSRERFKSYRSRYIYTAALDVLGKAKRPVEALNVFHAMREQGVSSYPDLATYHCIAVTLGQAGHIKELFDVIDCMRSPPQKKFKTGSIGNWDPRLEPDIIVYNAVLNACARRKQWEGAFWVLQQLKEQGLQPSSTTYGLVMEVMFACEKYNLVYEFFRKVEKSTIPKSLNYKVLVNTLWKEGKTDEALFAVQDMERRGVVGSASLYYDLARCLCSAGRCQEALMQMDKICKVAHKPLVVTYTGLIQACLDTGNIQNGVYIFKHMQEFCSPNLVTCNIMLKAYIEHKMFEDANALFQKMLDDSRHITKKGDYKTTVCPDSYTFNTMLDACTSERNWDEFSLVFQQMLHRGYNFNSKRHLRMILEACRDGKGEVLEITWKHMVQANRILPPPLVKERFCMKLGKEDYMGAISTIIAIHPTDNLQQLHAFSEKGWSDLLVANANRFSKDNIISLTLKLHKLVAGSPQPNPIIQNLILSCQDFIRSYDIERDDIHQIEIKEHVYLT
ncbi:hypothetical protein ACHQM5_017942 [Ranunculus cassubicifolius]